MSYATIERIRQLTGITTSEANDAVLTDLISLADNRIRKELNVRVINQKLLTDLDGDYIDGSNKTFYFKYTPIADTDFDKEVKKDEVTVYVWEDEEDESTKTTVTVSILDPISGRVVLTSAPANTADKVTADYSFYLGKTPDWNLVTDASSYLVGYLAIVRKKIPKKYSIGRFRVEDEGKEFYRQYQILLHKARGNIAKLSEPTKSLDKDVDY